MLRQDTLSTLSRRLGALQLQGLVSRCADALPSRAALHNAPRSRTGSSLLNERVESRPVMTIILDAVREHEKLSAAALHRPAKSMPSHTPHTPSDAIQPRLDDHQPHRPPAPPLGPPNGHAPRPLLSLAVAAALPASSIAGALPASSTSATACSRSTRGQLNDRF